MAAVVGGSSSRAGGRGVELGLGSGVQGRAAERLGRAVRCGHLHLGPATGERVTLCVVTGVHRAAVSRGGVQAAAEAPARAGVWGERLRGRRAAAPSPSGRKDSWRGKPRRHHVKRAVSLEGLRGPWVFSLGGGASIVPVGW